MRPLPVDPLAVATGVIPVYPNRSNQDTPEIHVCTDSVNKVLRICLVYPGSPASIMVNKFLSVFGVFFCNAIELSTPNKLQLFSFRPCFLRASLSSVLYTTKS